METTTPTIFQARCPCCGYKTLPKRADDVICKVCFWQDDGQDDPHADEVWGGPNKELSLTQARANYLDFGAVERKLLKLVRPPTPEEI